MTSPALRRSSARCYFKFFADGQLPFSDVSDVSDDQVVGDVRLSHACVARSTDGFIAVESFDGDCVGEPCVGFPDVVVAVAEVVVTVDQEPWL